MEDFVQQLVCVLLDRDVHLHLDGEGPAVDVAWVGTVLRCGLGQPTDLTLELDLLEDRLEPLLLIGKLLAQAVERRFRQFPSHRPSGPAPGR